MIITGILPFLDEMSRREIMPCKISPEVATSREQTN